MYVRTYVVSVFMYVRVDMCVYMSIYWCVSVYMHVGVYICMHMSKCFMCVRVYVYSICVFACVCIYVTVQYRLLVFDV
jgi:hypothetical protein